jgi:hypothetical protein
MVDWLGENEDAPYTGPANEPPKALQVSIRDIVRREEWQVRGAISDRTVRQYATAMSNEAVFPPVRLARVNGALVLIDGWHRLAALERLQSKYVRATVEDMTEEQARWEAAKANTTHGLALKPPEKLQVFKAYVQTGQHRAGRKFRTYREIAADLNGIADKSTIQRWMRSNFPGVADRMATGRAATTEWAAEAEGRQRSRLYKEAVKHLDQITSRAPALRKKEQKELAQRLAEAAEEVLKAKAWTVEDEGSDLDL